MLDWLVPRFVAILTLLTAFASAKPLHTDVPSPLLLGSENSTVGPKPGANSSPDAIRTDGHYLPKPNLLEGKDASSRTQRSDSMTMDTSTGVDPALTYRAVFNPSIAPFKRDDAFDKIGADGEMKKGLDSTLKIGVGGQDDDDRDLFWATLDIEMKKGRKTPIPSVSPGMRIRSYETATKVRLTFTKDRAGNYFVTPKKTVPGAQRVVMLVDGAADYFSPRPPFGHTFATASKQAPADSIAKLPANLSKEASAAAATLGLSASSDLRDGLDKLVAYHRAFSAKQLQRRGSLFSDLFSQQAGVCRHRSYSFFVLASHLGLPTRYVQNEAHAFVEVWMPTSNWGRIDLGGAASQLDIKDAQNKAMYRSRGSDPFPRPKNWSSSYSDLQGPNVTGLSDKQKQDKMVSRTDSNQSNQATSPRADVGLPEITAKDSVGKKKSTITIVSVDSEAFRGEDIVVKGSVTSTEKKTGLRVDVYLAQEADGADAVLVGHGECDNLGNYSVLVELPKSLATGKHRVFVTTAGNSQIGPSVSE